MKSISNFFITALLMCALVGCAYEETIPEKDNPCNTSSGLVITSTKVCGWFPNYDSMAIDGTSLRYYNHCLKNSPAREYHITCDEWNLLVSKLDIDEFFKLNNHTCNVCADGCDVSFAIKTVNSYHRITISPDQNLTPPQILEFVTEIEKWRIKFQAETCGS